MRTLCSLVVVALLFVFPAATFANAVYKADLIADGGSALTEIDVGDVAVWLVGNSLYVKYEVDDPWGLTETHVCVKEALADIPQKNANPIPGQFRKEETGEGREYDPPVSEDTYEIDVTGLDLSKLYIAAHAVVLFESENSIYVADSILIAGATTEAVLFNPGADDKSYFDVFVSESSSPYLEDGTYPGFCVDTDKGMSLPEEPAPQYPYHNYGPFGPFVVMVYSSYDPYLPACVIDVPENLDLVNWILTQDYVGQPGPCGPYTYGDVQVAIWMLIEDNIPPAALNSSFLGPTCEDNIDQIVQDAQAKGEGFVPGRSDKYGLILVPVDEVEPNPCEPVAQIFIIVVQASGDETAWGAIPEEDPDYPLDPNESNNDRDDSYAYDFPGSNWAHYIVYPPYGLGAPPKSPARDGVIATWGKLKL
jgi:hypothetical protein